LIASKTGVAPLKKQTIPRLELLAALILTRLTARNKTALEQCLVISRVRCRTDLKNVLLWIKRKDKVLMEAVCQPQSSRDQTTLAD